MAKKTKRTSTRENITKVEKNPTDALASGRPSGFNPDYQFVIKDLRRLGILAGSFFMLLVALALILHL